MALLNHAYKTLFQGPPPDPQFNFLSDRARDKPRAEFKDRKQGEKENRNGDKNNNKMDGTRRHHKNFGGTDFNNVKPKMKEVKERQVCEILLRSQNMAILIPLAGLICIT